MTVLQPQIDCVNLPSSGPTNNISPTTTSYKPGQYAGQEAWFLDDFDPREVLPAKYWRYTEIIRYVVGRVAMGPALRSRCRKERRGWFPLRKEAMKPLFGRSGRWNEIRHLLLDLEILECDGRYQIGEKAKWYRVGPTLQEHAVHLVTLRDQRLLARIGAAEAMRKHRTAWGPAHDHLARWLREARVDPATARRWVSQWKRSTKQRLTHLRILRLRPASPSPLLTPTAESTRL